MVEAPLEIQKTVTVPQNHYDVCAAAATPTAGNAAANTIDPFDLDGQNLSIAPLPAGFTAKGIVALVFSCIAAFLGMAVIAWYVAPPYAHFRVCDQQRISCACLVMFLDPADTVTDRFRNRYGAAPLSAAELAQTRRFVARAGGGAGSGSTT